MLGDLPSIVPRRNYDIRTQCLKGTCSSSELPGQWHAFVLDAVRPCRGCSSMLLRQRPMEGRLRVPLVDRIHCSGFPDRADDGVRTRGFLLGKQACCRCTTSAWPGFPNGFGPYPLRSAIGVLSRTREPRPRCEGWDSNPRPPGYEPGGLPNCPTPHGRAFPGTPHGRGVFRTARKGPFPGGGEKGPRMRADRRRQARHGGIEPPWTVLETVGLPLS